MLSFSTEKTCLCTKYTEIAVIGMPTSRSNFHLTMPKIAAKAIDLMESYICFGSISSKPCTSVAIQCSIRIVTTMRTPTTTMKPYYAAAWLIFVAKVSKMKLAAYEPAWTKKRTFSSSSIIKSPLNEITAITVVTRIAFDICCPIMASNLL